MTAYEGERLPPTAELVGRKRAGGPERVIDMVEQLAPDGLTHIDDVIDPRELDAVIAGYAAASGVTRALRTGRIGPAEAPPRGEAEEPWRPQGGERRLLTGRRP